MNDMMIDDIVVFQKGKKYRNLIKMKTFIVFYVLDFKTCTHFLSRFSFDPNVLFLKLKQKKTEHKIRALIDKFWFVIFWTKIK